jgi:outer membrane lipoprotein-sorting protein
MAAKRISRKSLAIILSIIGLSGSASAQNAAEIVNQWLATQTNIQTWSANFTQSRHLKALVQPLVSTGRVSFAAPSNFRWQIGGEPAQSIAIREGDTMQVIYPRAKRVEKYRFDLAANKEMKDTLALLQTGFPRSKEELDKQFSIHLESVTNGVFRLALEPKSAAARRMLPQVNVLLETNHFSLTGTELLFVDGSKMANQFTHIETNRPITAETFRFQAPADYKVSEPLK